MFEQTFKNIDDIQHKDATLLMPSGNSLTSLTFNLDSLILRIRILFKLLFIRLMCCFYSGHHKFQRLTNSSVRF
jgi:hypothetical protein